MNAGAALAVAQILGVADATVCGALPTVSLPEMRQQQQRVGGILWINDAYNANSLSVAALVDCLAEDHATRSGGQLYVVLGDMFELGEQAHRYHLEVLAHVGRELPAATVVPIGPEMAEAARELGLQGFTEMAAAISLLRGRLQAGDTVAVKGSRGMGMERLIAELTVGQLPSGTDPAAP